MAVLQAFSETGTMVGRRNLLLSGLTFFVFCKILCKRKKVVSNAVCGGFGGGVVWTVHGLPAHTRHQAGLFPPVVLLLFVTYHATFCAMLYLGRRIKALFIVLLVRSSL